jgi:hypothetical protein
MLILVNATAENTSTHHNGLRWLAYRAGGFIRGAVRIAAPTTAVSTTPAGPGDKPAETGWRPDPTSQRGACALQRLF